MSDIKREIKEEKILVCWKITGGAVPLNEKIEAQEDERHTVNREIKEEKTRVYWK